MKKIILNLLFWLFMAVFMIEVNAQYYAACCFGSYCVNIIQNDRHSIRGQWYEDETCPSFDCPGGCLEQMPNLENGLFSDIDCFQVIGNY